MKHELETLTVRQAYTRWVCTCGESRSVFGERNTPPAEMKERGRADFDAHVKSATTKHYRVELTFDVEGDHALAQIKELAEQAAIQIEDPRDMAGDRVDFATAKVNFVIEEEEEG